MTILFSDSGAGANENPLAGAWATFAGFNPYQRTSNVIYGTAAANNGVYVSAVGDQASSWIEATNVASGVTSVGLMLRCASSGVSQSYVFQHFNFGTPTANIARWDTGASYQSLAANASVSVLSPGDVLYFEAVGFLLTAKVNGSTVATYDTTLDGTKYASGRFGLYSFTGNGSNALSNITAGNFLSPVPPSPTPTNPIGRQGLAGGGHGKRPGIPAVDLKADPRIRKVLTAMKENIEISNGIRAGTGVNEEAWKRRTVSLNMLVKLGIITEEQARSVWQEP